MTEAEWFACGEPHTLLRFLGTRASDRKLRLFAVACCRRVWHLLTDQRSRQAVEVAKQYADGLVGRERLIVARDEARVARRRFLAPAEARASRAANAAQDVVRDTGRSAAWNCMAETSRAISIGDTNHCDSAEMRQQAALFRSIFDNPFQTSTISTSWLVWHDGVVRTLAQVVYDERGFDHLPILADALEDAGCTDAAILDHLRSPGPHVRGCHVLDALLGKS